MACLSAEKMVRIALGLVPDKDQSAHLDHCERCQSSLDTICSLLQGLGQAYARFDHQHEEARARNEYAAWKQVFCHVSISMAVTVCLTFAK